MAHNGYNSILADVNGDILEDCDIWLRRVCVVHIPQADLSFYVINFLSSKILQLGLVVKDLLDSGTSTKHVHKLLNDHEKICKVHNQVNQVEEE